MVGEKRAMSEKVIQWAREYVGEELRWVKM
jgi:hypothetical protein